MNYQKTLGLLSKSNDTIEIASIFKSTKPYNIIRYDWLMHKLKKYLRLDTVIFDVSYIYIDILKHSYPDQLINELTMFKFLIVSILIAVKVCQDDYLYNDDYAYVLNMDVRVLNQLEILFLQLIDFNVSHLACGF